MCSVKGQVDDVVGVMRGNMAKVLDRGAKLEDLEDKSGVIMALFTLKSQIHRGADDECIAVPAQGQEALLAAVVAAHESALHAHHFRASLLQMKLMIALIIIIMLAVFIGLTIIVLIRI